MAKKQKTGKSSRVAELRQLLLEEFWSHLAVLHSSLPLEASQLSTSINLQTFLNSKLSSSLPLQLPTPSPSQQPANQLKLDAFLARKSPYFSTKITDHKKFPVH
jgi:hypothetical protein